MERWYHPQKECVLTNLSNLRHWAPRFIQNLVSIGLLVSKNDSAPAERVTDSVCDGTLCQLSCRGIITARKQAERAGHVTDSCQHYQEEGIFKSTHHSIGLVMIKAWWFRARSTCICVHESLPPCFRPENNCNYLTRAERMHNGKALHQCKNTMHEHAGIDFHMWSTSSIRATAPGEKMHETRWAAQYAHHAE